MSAATRLNTSYVHNDVERRFAELIDFSDVASAAKSQLEAARKTRGLAAFALAASVPGLSDVDAAQHVTDGTGDCGIDALYHDSEGKRIVVVQAKWNDEGTGSIGLGDMRNTIAGLENLTNEQFDRFNSKFAHIIPSVELALADINTTFELIVTVTGPSALADEPQQAVDDALAELNEISELARFQVMGLAELRRVLVQDASRNRIDVEVSLSNWGPFSEPYAAYYGLVPAKTLAEWYQDFQGALFDKNLRKALGATSVNSAIIETVLTNPEHFWYFNNGVTALCDRVTKLARGGTSRLTGHFAVEGLSIVNGAQTVSSLAAVAKDAPEQLENVLVWIKLISLEGVPENFANDVTRSTNTQNAVEASDFLALDPQQSRIRDDFRLGLGKDYVFRRGEVPPKNDAGTSAAEALIALACAAPDSGLAVIAKSAVGRLEERQGRYYPQLVNSGTTADQIWNAVQVLRTVEDRLTLLRSQSSGKDRAIALQGNRVIEHLVFVLLGGVDRLRATRDDGGREVLKKEASKLTVSVFKKLSGAVFSKFPNNYVTSLFKNASRCSELVDVVVADLAPSA